MKALLRTSQILLVLLIAAGAFVVRCHNLRDTFIGGQIYFVDADCYARMSRVSLVLAHPGSIVRHHEFENYPAGVHSHTTAPLDYLIAGGQWLLDLTFAQRPWGRGSLLAGQTADLAGALISPLLGAFTCAFLALWGWRVARDFTTGALRAVCAAAPALLFTFSPILVHATILGRPDHQSLLVFMLALALGAEAMLALGPESDTLRAAEAHRWAMLAGLGWGGALWVSLYEPAILLGAVFLLLIAFERRGVLRRERLWEGGILMGLLVLSFAIEGWRLEPPAPEVRAFFAAWSRTIGEMRSVPLTSPILPQWLGWSCFVAPLLLVAAHWVDRRTWPWLALVLITLSLACWQLRWGPYLALVFALSLPWQLAVLRRGWIAAPALVLALFGTAQFWDETLFPNEGAREAGDARRRERVLLRDVAAHLQGQYPQPFLAPWWESPPLAYWSGQPGVAGSSHQSLGGIVEVSHFYLDSAASGSPAAAEILRRHQVAYVVADEADRLTGPAADLLQVTPGRDCLANRLNEDPNGAAPFLVPIYSNLFFKVFAVDPALSRQ